MHDISLHILDLIENSIRAKASVISIRLEIDSAADVMHVTVEDNGEGIRVAPDQVLNPFYTTHGWKRVGLGLSLFKAAAEMAQGQLTLSKSDALGGLAVRAGMRFSHVDRPPLGDLATTVSTMVLMNPEVDFHLSLRCSDRSYAFRLSEFKAAKGLDGSANVELANAVLEALQDELEFWWRYELRISGEIWGRDSRLFGNTWRQAGESAEGPARLEPQMRSAF